MQVLFDILFTILCTLGLLTLLAPPCSSLDWCLTVFEHCKQGTTKIIYSNILCLMFETYVHQKTISLVSIVKQKCISLGIKLFTCICVHLEKAVIGSDCLP